jgi:uncharacterized protein (TIGR03435 family)
MMQSDVVEAVIPEHLRDANRYIGQEIPNVIRLFAMTDLCMVFSGIMFGQASPSAPTFEVAAVKVNKSGEEAASANVANGALTLHNVPMKVILARAYQMTNDRVIGPGWLDTDRFDIVAKYSPETRTETLWLMLQNLLADRFRLVTHHEQKDMPVYALVVGKQGPKLKETSADNQGKSGCSRLGTQVTCQSYRTTMAQLAEQIPRWLPRDWLGLPLVDRTGLQGTYDLSLTWTLTERPPGADAGAAQAADSAAVNLFDAIQDQLGLRLEQRKLPVDRIVIDHIERVPAEN